MSYLGSSGCQVQCASAMCTRLAARLWRAHSIVTRLLHDAGQEAGSFGCCELLLLHLQVLKECSAQVQEPQQAGRVCSRVAQPDHTPPAPSPCSFSAFAARDSKLCGAIHLS